MNHIQTISFTDSRSGALGSMGRAYRVVPTLSASGAHHGSQAFALWKCREAAVVKTWAAPVDRRQRQMACTDRSRRVRRFMRVPLKTAPQLPWSAANQGIRPCRSTAASVARSFAHRRSYLLPSTRVASSRRLRTSSKFRPPAVAALASSSARTSSRMGRGYDTANLNRDYRGLNRYQPGLNRH